MNDNFSVKTSGGGNFKRSFSKSMGVATAVFLLFVAVPVIGVGGLAWYGYSTIYGIGERMSEDGNKEQEAGLALAKPILRQLGFPEVSSDSVVTHYGINYDVNISIQGKCKDRDGMQRDYVVECKRAKFGNDTEWEYVRTYVDSLLIDGKEPALP